MAARYSEELDALGAALFREFDGTAHWRNLTETVRHEWRQKARRVIAEAARVQSTSRPAEEGVPSESLRAW